MSNKQQYFHFTLGPVQSFVAQARRTRDFWAGSFLLSWLSAVAMKSTQAQTGNKDCILFPKADANFLDYISGIQTGEKPTQGSVPNRFKAMVSDDFKPKDVIADVQYAWTQLAESIYRGDLKNAKAETRAIWDRQVENFWDISWVLVDVEDNSAALDQRKNWRSYGYPLEQGVKCMMMDGWQELSGIVTPHGKGLAKFWEPLQTAIGMDLREQEHLCAMAFIKRRFVHYFEVLDNIPMQNDWQLSGWELPKTVPSVNYLAGAHWLEHAIEEADYDVFEHFFTTAYQLSQRDLNEWRTRLACIERLRYCCNGKDFNKWTSLDGGLFHLSVLENPNNYNKKDPAPTQKALSKLNKHLKEKHQQQDKPFTPATPFYAVLMMDGDSLGKQMSGGKAKQTAITDSLEAFTRGVKERVEKHSGFLIYAGGDDVLAILPLEDALPCAAELRNHYMECFKQHPYCDEDDKEQLIPTTLSGAIEYVHIKIPLTKVLFDAHHLLDDIAKEKTGRDSIAIRVHKPSGKALEWSQPWQIALNDKGKLVLDDIANRFRQEQVADDQFSSKFFYKIRERFDVLNPVIDQYGNEIHKAVLDDSNGEDIDFMCMEYLNSGATNLNTMQQAKQAITPLLEQCRRVTRNAKISDSDDWQRGNFLRVDGALLVRFLAHKGVE